MFEDFLEGVAGIGVWIDGFFVLVGRICGLLLIVLTRLGLSGIIAALAGLRRLALLVLRRLVAGGLFIIRLRLRVRLVGLFTLFVLVARLGFGRMPRLFLIGLLSVVVRLPVGLFIQLLPIGPTFVGLFVGTLRGAVVARFLLVDYWAR